MLAWSPYVEHGMGPAGSDLDYPPQCCHAYASLMIATGVNAKALIQEMHLTDDSSCFSPTCA